MIEIDFDKRRHLQFDLPTIQELEAKMGGMPLGAVVQQLAQAGVTATVMALCVGLKHEDPTLTPNLVTKMLQRFIGKGGSLLTLAQAINAAIEESGIFQGVAVDEPPEPLARVRRKRTA